MESLLMELQEIQEELQSVLVLAAESSARETLVALEERAFDVGRAHSRSWIGYHANLYYRDFLPPPPGQEFDPLSGKLWREQPLWVQYSTESVVTKIVEGVDSNPLKRATDIGQPMQDPFRRQKT